VKKRTVLLVLAKIFIFLALLGLFLLGYLWPEYQSRFSLDFHQIQMLIMILIGFFLFVQSMDSRLNRGGDLTLCSSKQGFDDAGLTGGLPNSHHNEIQTGS